MPRGPHDRPARVHPLVPVAFGVVLVVVLTVVAFSLDRGGNGGDGSAGEATAPAAPETSTTVPPAPVPVEPLLVGGLPVEAPTAYRITYDVVENGLPRVEEWTVRRPYESVVRSTRDGELLTGTSTSREVLQVFVSEQAGWLPIQPELHRAAYDQHPAGAVGAMEALGLIERRGEGEHVGRPCTEYRTGEPLSAADPTPPTDAEHTDVCIDGAGLVLHERWQIGGNVVIERTATAVEIEPDIDPAAFTPGPVVADAGALAQAFATIAVPADEETLAGLRTDVPVPDGYVEDGAVFRAAEGTGTSDGQPASAETVRFYSSGPDLLEVAEVGVDAAAPLASVAGVPVEVDGWDEVWFEPGFRTSFLRARLGETTYLELRHHDVAFLFDVLASIERR